MTTHNNDLKILQGKSEGDTYDAANRLAQHIINHYDIVEGEDLSDWLAEGDYDGDETIASLVSEWRSITKEAARVRNATRD